jgi:aspartate beta-hydroxylase
MANPRLPAVESPPARFAAYVAALAQASRPVPYPGLTRRPWHDPSTIPLARELTAAAPKIIAEYNAASLHFHPEAEPIPRTGTWDVAMLLERGRENPENCAQFPITMAILERHRTVVGPSGLAYLSRMGPHATVAEHSGPVNTRLRCHLGISVPEGGTITVGGVEKRWHTGACIVFDDSFPHSVRNESNHDRTVLVADVWHPDLTDEEVRLLAGLERYVTRAASQLHQYWSNNESANPTR